MVSGMMIGFPFCCLVYVLSLQSVSVCFVFLFCVSVFFFPFSFLLFSFCSFPQCCCLLLKSIMTESSGCFWTCTRNSGHTLVFTLAYTHRMELSYVSGDVMIERSLSYMLLLMVPEQAKDCHCCSYYTCILFCFLILVLSLSMYYLLFSVFEVLFWEVFL